MQVQRIEDGARMELRVILLPVCTAKGHELAINPCLAPRQVASTPEERSGDCYWLEATTGGLEPCNHSRGS